MLKQLKTYGVMGVASLLFLFATHTVLAQGGQTSGGGCPQGELCNPLQSETIQEFLLKIIDILIVFAMPIIILFIMYAGFLFVTAQGEEGKIRDAKNALLWAVVGGVILLGAKVIYEVIKGTVGSGIL